MDGGGSEMDFDEIETTVNSMDCSLVFHVVKDVIGFVLYMHQQIPSILQEINVEFDALHTEHKELEAVPTQTEVASSRRRRIGRIREVQQGIRRLQKFMDTFSCLQNALQLMVSEVPDIQGIILVIGGSPIRPQHVYELRFLHGRVDPRGACDFIKSRAAEALSRKAIRALISKGAGSASHTGPTKLFLLVKAPSSFNLPLHFLPKRDFRYSKKILPCRLQLKCKNQNQEIDTLHHDSQTASSSINLPDSTSDDLIWFQCRHVIKGLASKAASTEE